MTTRTRRRLTFIRKDDGSMILALLASLIVLAMLGVLAATAVMGQATARHDRSYTSVFQVADAGVQRVMFMLNGSKPTTGVLPADYPSSTVTGTLNTGTYSAYAQKTPSTREWTIYSTATYRGVTRKVTVTVQEDRLFFASAFADFSVGFNGGNVADTYNSGADGTAAFTPRAGSYGLVGSNGPVKFLGQSSTVDGVQLWGWKSTDTVGSNNSRCDGQAAIGLLPTTLKACDAAANTTINPIGAPYQQRPKQTRVLSPTTADLQTKTAACGSSNSFTALSTAAAPTTTTLSPATSTVANRSVAPVGTYGQNGYYPGYYCYSSLTINGNLTLTGASAENPVVIYVTGSVKVNGNGTTVNCVNCGTSPQTPNAAALQIYIVGNGTFDADPQTKFGMTVYGPAATCSGGAGDEIYGSLICGTIANVGNWGFHYDQSLENLGNSQFGILNYREN